MTEKWLNVHDWQPIAKPPILQSSGIGAAVAESVMPENVSSVKNRRPEKMERRDLIMRRFWAVGFESQKIIVRIIHF
jgi:hypothetical protein